jgi:hypothetical protein
MVMLLITHVLLEDPEQVPVRATAVCESSMTPKL